MPTAGVAEDGVVAGRSSLVDLFETWRIHLFGGRSVTETNRHRHGNGRERAESY